MALDDRQSLHLLAESPALAAIRQRLDVQRILEQALAIQQIPAPTFDEGQRAAYLRTRFVECGLREVATDDLHNVYGRWPGADSSCPALMISAHTDTVFPAGTELGTRQEQERVFGPGLGDNSLGVAGLLALIEIFTQNALQPASDIWFVANSREEGLGNLGGMRAAWERLRTRLGAAIVVEGMALGRIYHAAIAVRRLHITCHAPGGHSWLHFGQPSAIHGLIELGAQIIALVPPARPRTTYNIGLIEGGHSVNSLATSASFYLDLRSEQPDSLAALEQQVMQAVTRLRRPGLDFDVDVVGDRPAGQIALDHPLVQCAAAALDVIGHPVTYEIGSTDANFLLASGLPTVTVGVSYGGHAHRLDEFIETAPVADGVWQLLLLALASAGQVGHWKRLAAEPPGTA